MVDNSSILGADYVTLPMTRGLIAIYSGYHNQNSDCFLILGRAAAR